MKRAQFTGSNIHFLATSKTASYWKLNTDAVTEVVICQLCYVRSGCTGTVIEVEGFDSLSQIYLTTCFDLYWVVFRSYNFGGC
jgi:hypothetical protein